MVDLGAEFQSPPREPNVGSVLLRLAEPGPDPSISLLEEIRAALVALPALVAAAVHVDIPPPPAPIVHVAEPDLSAIVTAVNGLKPGATAQDIGREIATQLNPQARTDESMMVEAMRQLVEKIDFRLQGVGRAFGSSGPSNIADNANRQLGIVSITGSLPQLPLSLNPLVGQVTVSVTGTAVQLPNNVLINGVIVQALKGNSSNTFVVGASGVTTSTGFQLQPGQAASAGVQNTNSVWINGTSGDGVCFLGS